MIKKNTSPELIPESSNAWYVALFMQRLSRDLKICTILQVSANPLNINRVSNTWYQSVCWIIGMVAVNDPKTCALFEGKYWQEIEEKKKHGRISTRSTLSTFTKLRINDKWRGLILAVYSLRNLSHFMSARSDQYKSNMTNMGRTPP